jgi:hypothetical protein
MALGSERARRARNRKAREKTVTRIPSRLIGGYIFEHCMIYTDFGRGLSPST